MAAGLGNNQKFYIRNMYRDTSHVPAVTAYHFNWLGCETANSVNRTQEAVECSDKSSNWAQFLAGKRGGTVEATAYADNDDEQQVELLNALHQGMRLWVLSGERTSSMSIDEDDEITNGELMQGIITGISDTNDFGSCSTRQFTLQVHGEISHYPELEEEEE